MCLSRADQQAICKVYSGNLSKGYTIFFHWNPLIEIEYRWVEYFKIFQISLSWASYQIRKISGMFPRHQLHTKPPRTAPGKPLVSDGGMHHGTCVTHMPWCISGSLTRRGRETVPGIPGACTNPIFDVSGKRSIWLLVCIGSLPTGCLQHHRLWPHNCDCWYRWCSKLIQLQFPT